jgi:YhcH/YjgK/YiaL family protein
MLDAAGAGRRNLGQSNCLPSGAGTFLQEQQMIFDSIHNARNYIALSSNMRLALDYLASTDFESLEPGRHEIRGDDVFVMLSRYDSKMPGQGKWEAHRRYLDVQFIAAGRERMGIAPLEAMSVSQEYDQQKDLVLLSGEGQFVAMAAGDFMVLYPHEAHMPGMAVADAEKVTKVVVKVLVE